MSASVCRGCAPIDPRCSGGEEFFPNRRGTRKSPPQLSSSSSRLGKKIVSTTQKTAPPTLDEDQSCDVLKKRSRVNESRQKTSTMKNAGPSWNKTQHSKNSSGKRQSRSQVPHISSHLRSSLGASQPAADKYLCPGGKPQQNVLSPRCQGASGNQLFLDFQSMKIMKEAADEDSASDLSDSERVPIPPSPFTPPDLRLRAEEIDPVCFDFQPGQDHHAKPDYHYPDFLPPPFSSWDLRDMAMLLNSESRTGAVPRAGGLVGKYIDRLLQLEWLQIQTVQWEKGKGAKARPPTAPGTPGALKSPRKSKLLASALPRPLPHPEGAAKSGRSRKKDLPHEQVHPSYYTFEASSRPTDVPRSARLCPQKQTSEMKMEEKKKKSSKTTRGPPRPDLPCSDISPKMETNGNIRAPRQPALAVDSADPWRAPRTQAHANLKKKGNAGNGGPATVSSEKKLKTNGGKQSTCKLK